MHYQIIVLLLDAEEPLSGGVGVDHPGLSIGQWFVEKVDEVAVVSSVILGRQLMHSRRELGDDFLLQEGFSFGFFWFGDCGVDLVPVFPLFPSHVMQVEEDASEPFSARSSEAMLFEIAHLDALPGLGSQTFK